MTEEFRATPGQDPLVRVFHEWGLKQQAILPSVPRNLKRYDGEFRATPGQDTLVKEPTSGAPAIGHRWRFAWATRQLRKYERAAKKKGRVVYYDRDE